MWNSNLYGLGFCSKSLKSWIFFLPKKDSWTKIFFGIFLFNFKCGRSIILKKFNVKFHHKKLFTIQNPQKIITAPDFYYDNVCLFLDSDKTLCTGSDFNEIEILWKFLEMRLVKVVLVQWTDSTSRNRAAAIADLQVEFESEYSTRGISCIIVR